MKKLYKKGTVHPSPPLVSGHLSFLPATILTLAAALSTEDREVLAYLISCSSSSSSGSFSGNRKSTQKTTASGGGGKSVDHPPSYSCNCFRCYMSYWVRWDSSPNRQLIHEIIDAFEDGLAKGKKDKNKKERRKRGSNKAPDDHESKKRSEIGSNKDELAESESMEETSIGSGGGGRQVDEEEEDCGGGGGEEEVEGEFEKGSVRKFVSFLGEKFWGVWN